MSEVPLCGRAIPAILHGTVSPDRLLITEFIKGVSPLLPNRAETAAVGERERVVVNMFSRFCRDPLYRGA